MSYFHRSATGLDEPRATHDAAKTPFADAAGRFANWIAGVERYPEDDDDDTAAFGDPMRDLRPTDDVDETARFPVTALGYNRAAVEEHILMLEREIAALRAREPKPMSVTEELERIGEQTASILVVAHDKANETTRRAEEQAERCVADAAANAVAITNEAKQRLREIDSETDSVWRERERLLGDIRSVSAALASLADQAEARFPADADASATAAFPIAAGYGVVASKTPEPQATVAFTPEEYSEYGEADAGDSDAPESRPAATYEPNAADGAGDTGSWLAGFEPPDSAA